MELVEGSTWKVQVPEATYTKCIFHDGNGTQTDDLALVAGMNCYDFATGTWSVYGA